MFEKIKPIMPDPIFKLGDLYKKDSRSSKIDLSIGVFKDEYGNTPIMKSVRIAEKRLHQNQKTKAYVGISGDELFNHDIINLVFGDVSSKDRVRGVQTPGGCGALKILSDLIFRISRESTIWVSDPTWKNHYPIFQQAGLKVDIYPYLNESTQTIKENEMLDKFSKLEKNDVVLLHGCCHNPTGIELSKDAWKEIGLLSSKNGFFLFIDFAYQGFSKSIEEDAYGIRLLAETVESMVVSTSCSKNFGLYRERVGCALLMGETESQADIARTHILSIARSSYSMPPDHGAALVHLIMSHNDLKQLWEKELDMIRNRIVKIRKNLSNILKKKQEQMIGTLSLINMVCFLF